MLIFYHEFSIASGIALLQKSKKDRYFDGQRISACSGAALWITCYQQHNPMTCWRCKVKADRFILKHHVKEVSGKPPVLELYAHTGKSLVMMTRDHIIPASLGGIDDVANLRPACATCNNNRQNSMDKEDQEFMDANPHLIKSRVSVP